jgi:hypothetical protein
MPGKFTHNNTASVPWANIKSLEWFGEGSWIDDVTFVDPSKLKEVEARAVYRAWVVRQEDNLVPFEFIKALDRDVRVDGIVKKPQARKPKLKNPWVDVTSSEDEDEEDSDKDNDKDDTDQDTDGSKHDEEDDDHEAGRHVSTVPGQKRKRADDSPDKEDPPSPSPKHKKLSAKDKGKFKARVNTARDESSAEESLPDVITIHTKPVGRRVKIGEAGPSHVAASTQKTIPKLLNVPRATETAVTVVVKKKKPAKMDVQVPKSQVVTRSKRNDGRVTRQKAVAKKSK